MRKWGIVLGFLLCSVWVWAQDASTNEFKPSFAVNGLVRVHYDNALSNNAGWGKGSYYYAGVTLSGEAIRNLKWETSFDMGTFSGQRYMTNGYLGETNQVLVALNFLQTANVSYRVMDELVFTAGRMWEYFAPEVFSHSTRDGFSVSGKAFGILSYGYQLFYDSILMSRTFPSMELMAGIEPIPGLTFRGVGFYASKAETNRLGFSGNIWLKKMQPLPDLNAMVEVTGVANSTNGTHVYGMEGYLMLGYKFGSFMPFVELFGGDSNFNPASASDYYLYTRLAVRWDVNANLALVPYVRYDFLKKGAALADPWSVRVRMDAKF